MRLQRAMFPALLAVLVYASASAGGAVLGVDVHGFVDARGGGRTQGDSTQKQESLGETRLQVDLMRYGETATLQVRSDFLYDPVLDDHDVDLEEGRGWIDLREANLLFSPVSFADVKLGRQILTWGTGDLLFINDLFPKDWNAFFIGRDEEFLKAPSDALFASFFPSFANVDLVYTPRFDADRFVSGDRLSFWNPGAGRRTGRDAVVDVDRPNDWLHDDEVALRISRNVGGYEWAGYGYRGFWKSPAGSDPERGDATFPRLQVFGASVRGQFAEGIMNLEGGYYDSLDDRNGNNPLIRNSEWRGLVGYQQEVARDLTAAVQYYLEHMADHDGYRRALPDGQHAPDADRHVLTLRLTQLLMEQDLVLSFFAYYSPSDDDAYLRPAVSYKMTDDWKLTAGGNVFLGARDDTFFGQFEDNSNVYAAARYSF